MKIPPSFDKIGFFGDKFSFGVLVLSSSNSKFFNSIDSPILASIIANLCPMQTLGPSPKISRIIKKFNFDFPTRKCHRKARTQIDVAWLFLMG